MSNNAVFQSIMEYPLAASYASNTAYQAVIETARPANQYLFVSGALGNNRIDRRVISLKRYAHLCLPPQRGTLVLDTTFPRDVINPGEPLVLYERGTKVLTGYVTKVTRARPSYDWIIDFEDTYTRVTNTFISDNEMKFETATSMKYLLQTILDLTGISYRIGGPDFVVAPGINLSLRSAHDALTEILAYGQLYAWVDPDGTLRLRRAPGRRFLQNVRDPISTHEIISTDQTRNDVHVYGAVLANGVLVNTAAYTPITGLIVDLKTVVANPLLTTYFDAQRIADTLLHELGSLTDVLTFEMEGDPTLHIGTSGSFYHQNTDGVITSGSGPITSMETTIDTSGYKMNVTIGERCPRIAGWTQPPNQMRAFWIACDTNDTVRPQKLVWSGDFGLGGQPTWNIVKTVPSGTLRAMHVTRDGSRVYIVVSYSTITEPVAEIWYSDNPYDNAVEWKRLIGSGDDIYPGSPTPLFRFMDHFYFGTSPVTSMMMIGNDLHFVFRIIETDVIPNRYSHLYWIHGLAGYIKKG